MNAIDVLKLAAELNAAGEPCVLATVVESTGGTPGRPGFKMLLRADGSIHGTVGGGDLERRVTESARELLQIGGSTLQTFTLTEDADGMVCGGNISVFIEQLPPARRAFLFGAGHLCQSLAPLLRSIGFHSVIIDDRPDMATPQRVPQGGEFHTVHYADYARTFSPGPADSIIIFTHGHSADYDVLRELCLRRLDCAYIGMIGSRRKIPLTFQQIIDAGGSPDWLKRVHAPIGLNVARTTPAEIAVAIAAEMLAVYNGVEEIKKMRNTGGVAP